MQSATARSVPTSWAAAERASRYACIAAESAQSASAFLAGRMVSGLGVFGDGSGVVPFQNVDTHPQHRNKGLAGTLVHEASRYAKQDLGAPTQVIVADQTGTAIRIHRSVGFRGAETQVQLQRRQPG
jgi:predicted GNAT family acetyltransferase